MMSTLEAFAIGMDRAVSELAPFPPGVVLNLGAGKKLIDGTISLDADRGWRAPRLPYDRSSVAGVYAFHFLEHLDKLDALAMLREIERVLIPGGSLVAIIPLAGTELSFQDLDHKSFWTEQTWKNIFDNDYYDGTMPRGWAFEIRTCLILGIVQRNLVTLTQIIRK